MSYHRHLLERAQAGDAVAVEELWRALAAREVDAEVAAAWLADVAQLVVGKVLDAGVPANRRAEAALKAIGFEGKRDESVNKNLEEVVTQLDAEGPAVDAERVVAGIRLTSSDLQGVTDKNAVRRVKEIRKKLQTGSPDDT